MILYDRVGIRLILFKYFNIYIFRENFFRKSFIWNNSAKYFTQLLPFKAIDPTEKNPNFNTCIFFLLKIILQHNFLFNKQNLQSNNEKIAILK